MNTKRFTETMTSLLLLLLFVAGCDSARKSNDVVPGERVRVSLGVVLDGLIGGGAWPEFMKIGSEKYWVGNVTVEALACSCDDEDPVIWTISDIGLRNSQETYDSIVAIYSSEQQKGDACSPYEIEPWIEFTVDENAKECCSQELKVSIELDIKFATYDPRHLDKKGFLRKAAKVHWAHISDTYSLSLRDTKQ